jgi:hypothetical protein
MVKTSYISNKIGVLDETLKQYSDLSYLFHFMDLNNYDNILGILPANSNVITDDYNLKNSIPVVTNFINSNPDVSVSVVENQTIFDLSVRFFGDISQVLNLILNNSNVDNINQNIVRKNLLMNKPNNFNKNVIYYNENGLIFTTGIYSYAAHGTTGRSFNISFNFSFD